jgi:hypothetical protein
LSFTEWAARLNRHISPDEVIDWWVVNPVVWIAESTQIRDSLYPDDPELSWDYIYFGMPIVRQRLAKGGVRLAAYLNALFAEASAPPGAAE